jgi:hypothetical protein
MRTVAFLIFLSGALSADVVLLKDGARVSGRVTDKGLHYEVALEGGGLRTYLKDEVERVVNSPKEFLGDSERLYEEAKRDYSQALEIASPEERNARLKEAITKVQSVRQTISQTRELFPEDKYAELDLRLMQVMQLLRLLRERVGSEYARRDPVPERRAVPTVSLTDALGTLLDPVRRADLKARLAARDAFQAERGRYPEIYELATAAMLYLSRSDADWKLQAPALKALEEYFAKPYLREALRLTPALHLEAATFLAERLSALRKADQNASAEPITLFGIGHVGQMPPGPDSDRAAKLFGLEVRSGIPGTPEGHVVRDLDGWIGAGDFDLAVLAWVKEYRQIDTPVVRFVWSYALLRLVQEKKRGYERPVAALSSIPLPSPSLRDHIVALQKSIRAAAVCNQCQGEGKLRCTNCHGKKEIRYVCQKCKGKGKVPDPGYAHLGGGGLGAPELPCYPCRGRGYDLLIKCEKCKDGWNDCKQCDRKPRTPPELEAIVSLTPCELCEGRGFVFRRILWACKGCMGVGQRMVPKADPGKTLP